MFLHHDSIKPFPNYFECPLSAEVSLEAIYKSCVDPQGSRSKIHACKSQQYPKHPTSDSPCKNHPEVPGPVPVLQVSSDEPITQQRSMPSGERLKETRAGSSRQEQLPPVISPAQAGPGGFFYPAFEQRFQPGDPQAQQPELFFFAPSRRLQDPLNREGSLLGGKAERR